MANLSIVIVPAKKLSNGRHRVRIAVAHRSQTRYISTQFILDSANQMKNGRVVKHENAANINACLRKLINEYEEILSSIHYQSNISCTELIRIIRFPVILMGFMPYNFQKVLNVMPKRQSGFVPIRTACIWEI